MANNVWDALHDLGPFVQIKTREKHHEGLLLLVTKNNTLFHVCFSRF